MVANQTYYLRVKTSTACTINIGGQYYTPANDDCIGASPIDETFFADNNACHHAGPGVINTDLCATTLENTAFYYYYVATTGTSIITINSISCDNGGGANSNGFQIGFFRGDCSSLIPLSCQQGAGGMVQATNTSLNAGTKVYVAVDGVGGSNCAYTIQAFNAYVLSSVIKNFSAWESSSSNTLKWTSTGTNIKYFEIERSIDSRNFYPIGRIAANSETSNYSFEDYNLLQNTWYRIKEVLNTDAVELSRTVMLKREQMKESAVYVSAASNLLKVQYNSARSEKINLLIINLYGQTLLTKNLSCQQGINRFENDISRLPVGRYIAILFNERIKINKNFFKAY
jgi:hypothetical protein